MATQFYLPGPDDQRDAWLTNFAAKLPSYAAKYGINVKESEVVGNSSEWFSAILTYQSQFATFNNNITAFKNALRNGLEKGATLSPLVVPKPTLPSTGATVGTFELVASVVAKIKSSLNYSVADGRDLGIEGTPIPAPDPATLAPILAVGLAAGGHPDLKWKKQNMPQLEICVDRGSGKGWEPLAISTQAHYVDTHELPAAGTSALWKYRAIFRQKDVTAGQWSAVVTAAVVG